LQQQGVGFFYPSAFKQNVKGELKTLQQWLGSDRDPRSLYTPLETREKQYLD
jgi:hypothetical protein